MCMLRVGACAYVACGRMRVCCVWVHTYAGVYSSSFRPAVRMCDDLSSISSACNARPHMGYH